jgi:hypothetical protein
MPNIDPLAPDTRASQAVEPALVVEGVIMSKSTGFTEADVPNQSGKCFIVTGANTGIGFEITRSRGAIESVG